MVVRCLLLLCWLGLVLPAQAQDPRVRALEEGIYESPSAERGRVQRVAVPPGSETIDWQLPFKQLALYRPLVGWGLVKEIHEGIDCGPKPGSSRDVVAAAEGVVVYVRTGCPQSTGSNTQTRECGAGWGNHIVVGHPKTNPTLYTRYAHLLKGSLQVKVGDVVGKGKKLAVMGNSGRSDGDHLHFEVGTRADPFDPAKPSQNFDCVYDPMALFTARGLVPEAPPMSVFVRDLVDVAEQQWDTYHKQKETAPALSKQIRKYWVEIGLDFPGVRTAWSAVFVSWCLKTAGATKEEFNFSSGHWVYNRWAIRNQRRGEGLFRGRQISEYQPKIGDLLSANRGGGNVTYDRAGDTQKSYESHSNIVVNRAEDRQGEYIELIGGNESDSVGKSKVYLKSGLVPQRSPNPYICIIENLK